MDVFESNPPTFSYLLLKCSPSASNIGAIFLSSLCITISSFWMLSVSPWSSMLVAARVWKTEKGHKSPQEELHNTCGNSYWQYQTHLDRGYKYYNSQQLKCLQCHLLYSFFPILMNLSEAQLKKRDKYHHLII